MRASLGRFVVLLLLVLPFRAAAAEKTGAQIFKLQCANCHGHHGQGGKKYKKPLAGDHSVGQLAKVIFDTMPESNPGSLSQKEADRVAAYVYDAFYSPTARERNRPARIELARLTVAQYRQTVSDLIGSFRQPAAPWGNQRGLRAEYFKGRNFNRGSRVLERTDPQVNFDFGVKAPIADKIEPHEFLIRWNGSLLAPETGEYEFTIHTEHAARLWINDNQRPLIDAWVKSGNDTEYKASLFLVGGRVYPLRLEYSKGKKGVDDSKKDKSKPKPVKSSIILLWQRPQHVAEPIPTRQLSPTNAAETYVCTTEFPPDDRSYGWERGTTVSPEWDQAATEAALETAGYVASRLEELAGVRDNESAESKKLREFCHTFVERAFRRPLTALESQVFVDKQLTAAKDAELAAKRVVLLTLKSPQFLYRELGSPKADYDTAARLSYGMWDSMPDKELFDAAAAGKLSTKEQIVHQADRMLADSRAKFKLRGFLLKWAKADQPADLSKDAKEFPGFDAAVISDLRTSLELFLDDVVWSDKSDFRQLVLAEDLFLNGRLAKFYGVKLPVNADFTKTKLNTNVRAGVLTHPYLMASLRTPPRRLRSTAAYSWHAACSVFHCGRRPRRSPRWPLPFIRRSPRASASSCKPGRTPA